MGKRIVIDLGSTVCRAFAEREEGVAVLPSLVALDRGTGKPLYYGEEARLASLRTPGDVDLIRPFADPKQVEPQLVEGFLREMARELDREKGLRANLLLVLPTFAGKEEEKPFLDGALGAEGKNVTVLHPLCPVMRQTERTNEEKVLLLHVGASASALCLCCGEQFSDPVTVLVGGKAFDDALGDHVYDRHGILLDDFAAEEAKLAGAAVGGGDGVIECRGLARKIGLPRKLSMPAAELADPFRTLLAALCAPIGSLISEFGKPDRVALSGGGAKLKGLKEALEEAAGAPCSVTDEPENVVILGLKKLVENKEI